MSNVVFNTLSLDEGAVIKQIQAHLINALEKAEDTLLDIMRREIQKTTNGNTPGKPYWRTQVGSMLRETYRTVTDEYIEAGVGLPENVAEHIFVRAMLIEAGSGTYAGNPPIFAGPLGSPVWDDDLYMRHPSTQYGTWLLPARFNQEGNHFIENAVKLMQKHFIDVLDEAADSLPSSVFYNNIRVRGGYR